MLKGKLMKSMKKNRLKDIYLDYAASTPIDENVLKKINLLNKDNFANPSAIHKKGVEVGDIIEESRKRIADVMNAHADEIIFTGSGTESIALSLLGIIYNFNQKPKTKKQKLPHIVTTNIEHPAVLENCKMLEERGLTEVTYVEVETSGIVNPKKIRDAIKENTVLVSVMYANNEIGTIQPIREIAKEIRHFRKNKWSKECFIEMPRERDGASSRNFSAEKYPCISGGYSLRNAFPVFHTDACQAMNYLEIENIDRLGVDLLSFNSSKIYGPKGVGVLYKRRGINLSPIYQGGGQEFGLRSGTENLANIFGVAEALELTEKIKHREVERLMKLRDYAISKLLELSKKSDYEIKLNGDREKRLPNNINISIKGIKSELLVIELDAYGIYVSEKSACHSENGEVSYVLRSIRRSSGETFNEEEGSIRISLGRQIQKKDIDYLVSSIIKILEKYKKFKYLS